jgi:hypothetical protein
MDMEFDHYVFKFSGRGSRKIGSAIHYFANFCWFLNDCELFEISIQKRAWASKTRPEHRYVLTEDEAIGVINSLDYAIAMFEPMHFISDKEGTYAKNKNSNRFKER